MAVTDELQDETFKPVGAWFKLETSGGLINIYGQQYAPRDQADPWKKRELVWVLWETVLPVHARTLAQSLTEAADLLDRHQATRDARKAEGTA